MLLLSADFFSKLIFSKYFFPKYYHSEKWFGNRSGPTFCLHMLSVDDKTLGQIVVTGRALSPIYLHKVDFA